MSALGINRDRTAIRRTDLSRPVRAALETDIINSETSVLDYGCGLGDDLERLTKAGITCTGWDPHFKPRTRRKESDVVNLGFVLNVIEDLEERAEVLSKCWGLTKRVLLISARTTAEAPPETLRPYTDGVITGRETFQKFYKHTELKSWVEGCLSTQVVSVEPGIVFAFKNSSDRHGFLAQLLRRPRVGRARIRQADRLYEEHKEAIDSLLQFYEKRGRAPKAEEFPHRSFIQEVGSGRAAVNVLRRLVGREQLSALRDAVRRDLLVYLSLNSFGGRPRFGELPDDLRHDIRAHFGRYRPACEEADRTLFQSGNPMLIDAECRDAGIGKLTPTALCIHRSALDELTPELRVYEGCARVLIGDVPSANVIQLSRREPQISYLSYPDFDDVAHPRLVESYTVKIRSLRAKYYSYSESVNPQILHRKEMLVADSYPGRAKFARLTSQEESQGLLDQSSAIGNELQWKRRLAADDVEIRGHRLFRRKSEAL